MRPIPQCLHIEVEMFCMVTDATFSLAIRYPFTHIVCSVVYVYSDIFYDGGQHVTFPSSLVGYNIRNFSTVKDLRTPNNDWELSMERPWLIPFIYNSYSHHIDGASKLVKRRAVGIIKGRLL